MRDLMSHLVELSNTHNIGLVGHMEFSTPVQYENDIWELLKTFEELGRADVYTEDYIRHIYSYALHDDTREKKYVVTNLNRDEFDVDVYTVILHELGHLIAPGGSQVDTNIKDLNGHATRPHALDEELTAWTWALDTSKRWDASSHRLMQDAVLSYMALCPPSDTQARVWLDLVARSEQKYQAN